MAEIAARLELVTAAAAPAVSRDEAKMACRVDHDSEDGLFDLYCLAATQMLADRGYLGQSLGETVWRAYWDGPIAADTVLLLPASPLAAANKVTRIAIDAGEGAVDQTVGDYTIWPDKFAPTIEAPDGIWPTTKEGAGAVIVEFTAGEETVSAPVKLACLALIAFWFDNRDGGITAAPPQSIWDMLEGMLVNERRF